MKKINVKIAISAIIILGLAILTIVRWNAWFGNPDEPAYSTANKINRLTLTLGNNGEYSRAFSWVYGESQSEGSLDITKVGSTDTSSIPAECNICQSRSGKTAYFRVYVDFLTPGADYKYRVKNGNEVSPWYQFSTLADSAKNNFSFLYFGDIQDSDSSTITRQLMNEIYEKNQESQFVLLGGDFIERPMDLYYNMAHEGLGKMAQELPILAVPGNHEYLKGIVRKIDDRYPYAFPYFLKSNVKKNHVFSFPYGNARFYFLDSNRDFWNFFEQRSWLKNELQKSDAQWNIVVLHHPIYSLKGGLNNWFVKRFFRSVIEKSKVDIVFQAHEHGYGRRRTTDEVGHCTPLYSVSYFSEKAYLQDFNGDYERWGTANRYYQKISINGDTLSFRTYTDQHELYDDVCLTKSNGRTIATDNANNIPENVIVPEWFRRVKGEKKTQKYEQLIQDWKEKKSKQ
ncbi:MAG: metallophosphoesterase [Paludibacteraceae bacterium]|nr:metallophosphoesterase [Paludibacteraceae bacterium]